MVKRIARSAGSSPLLAQSNFKGRLTPVAAGVRASCIPAGLILFLTSSPVFAGPEGGVVSAGQGSIATPDANTTTVTQVTKNLVLDWQTFNLAEQEVVQFIQPNTKATALNRINDQNPSQIFGSIIANGNVILLNPSGVFFSPTSSVNVHSLTASSLNIKNEDFMAGNYIFQAAPGQEGGAIINQGEIAAATGGSVTLMGGAVSNEGLIVAHAGQVNLVAGNKVTVDFSGDGLMQFAIDKEILTNTQALDAAVKNTGTIEANGGTVLMAGSAAAEVFSSVVNNAGIIRAGRIENQGGVIRLVASGAGASVINTGTLNADAADATSNGGTIGIFGANVTQSGTVSANSIGGKGGSINIQSTDTTLLSGNSVTSATSLPLSSGEGGGEGGSVHILGNKVGILDMSTIDVSGALGGGTVLVGGDRHGDNPDIQNASRTYVSPGSIIRADAIVNGDGGKVIVWSDEVTRFYGSIYARGGAEGGDGGFVETSGAQNLAFSGAVDVSAPSGTAGVLLLDPDTINVNDTGTPADEAFLPDIFFADGGAVTFNLSDESLEAIAAGTIILQATTDINFNVDVDLVAGVNIVAQAGNDINFASTADLTTLGTGFIHIEADTPHSGSTGSGTIVFAANAGVHTASGAITLIANDFTVNTTNADIISTGGGNITIARSTNSALTLGTAGQLTDGELDRVSTSGILTLGQATTRGAAGDGAGGSTLTASSITLDTDITPASVSTVHLITSGGVDGTTGGIAVTNLAIAAGGTVNITDASTNVTKLAVSNAGQSVTFTEADGFSVDTVDSVKGITSAALTLTATTGNITVADSGVTSEIDASGAISLMALAADADIILNPDGNVKTSAGGITFSADDMDIGATVTAIGQTVTLKPTANIVIEFEGTDGATELSLSDAELDNISATTLIVGKSTAGAITISGDISPGSITDLHLITGSTVTGTAGGIVVSGLAIESTGTVNITDATTNVTTLAANVTGAGNPFTFQNELDGFTVGTVDSVAGIKTADSGTSSGGITLSAAAGDITVNNDIITGNVSEADVAGDQTPTSGTISITAASSITGSANITTGTAELTGAAAGATTTDSANSGSINLTATGGAIGLSGTLTVGTAQRTGGGAGTDTTNAGSINLTSSGEINNGTLSTPLKVLIGDATGGAVNNDGKLNITTTSAAGNAYITSAGDLTLGTLNTLDASTQTMQITVTGGKALTVANISVLDQDDLTLTADRMLINNTITAGTATLRNESAGRAIDLGSATDVAAALELSDTELDKFTVTKLIIGRNDGSAAGDITISTDIAPIGTSTLHLITGKSVDGTAGGIVVTNLAIEAGSTGSKVEITAATTDVGTLAIDTVDDDVTFYDANDLTIGSVDGVTGVDGDNIVLFAGGGIFGDLTINKAVTSTVTGGDVLLKADNTITFGADGDVLTDAGDVTVNSDFDASSAGAIVMNSGSSITSKGGNIVLGGGADPTTTAAKGTAGAITGVTVAGDLYAGGGNIDIHGDSYTSGAFAFGVNVTGGNVTTTGAGNISITGNALHASNSPWAVTIWNSGLVSTEDGNITLDGVAGTGANAVGVLVNLSGQVKATGSGNITANGTAGAGLSGSRGVDVEASSLVSTNSGDITLTGISNGAGAVSLNVGVHVNLGGQVDSTSGSIILTGTGGTGSFGYGVFVDNSNIGSGTSGDITLRASTSSSDSISLDGTTKIQGTGNLYLEPGVDSHTIGIADGAPGKFNLSKSDLDTIQDGFKSIVIGSATGTGLITFGDGGGAGYTFNDDLLLRNPGAGSSGITIDDDLSVGTNDLAFDTDGSIDHNSGDIIASGLLVQSFGAVTLSGAVYDLKIDTLAASVTGAGNSFSLTDEFDGFAVGTVTIGPLSLSGITTASVSGSGSLTSGSITLDSAGQITTNKTVKTGDATSTDDYAGSGYISITGKGAMIQGDLITGEATTDGVYYAARSGYIDVFATGAPVTLYTVTTGGATSTKGAAFSGHIHVHGDGIAVNGDLGTGEVDANNNATSGYISMSGYSGKVTVYSGYTGYTLSTGSATSADDGAYSGKLEIFGTKADIQGDLETGETTTNGSYDWAESGHIEVYGATGGGYVTLNNVTTGKATSTAGYAKSGYIDVDAVGATVNGDLETGEVIQGVNPGGPGFYTASSGWIGIDGNFGGLYGEVKLLGNATTGKVTAPYTNAESGEIYAYGQGITVNGDLETGLADTNTKSAGYTAESGNIKLFGYYVGIGTVKVYSALTTGSAISSYGYAGTGEIHIYGKGAEIQGDLVTGDATTDGVGATARSGYIDVYGITGGGGGAVTLYGVTTGTAMAGSGYAYSGNIHVHGDGIAVKGDLTTSVADTQSGWIELSGYSGAITVYDGYAITTSYDGDITLVTDGDITLYDLAINSTNGDIYLESYSGEIVDAGASDFDADITTVSGAITLIAGKSIGAGDNIDVAGATDLTIAAGNSFDINSYDGSTLTDLSITVSPTGSETYKLTNFNGLTDFDSITSGLFDLVVGDLGISGIVSSSGSPLNISITSRNGDILLADLAIDSTNGGNITLESVFGDIKDFSFVEGDPNLITTNGSVTLIAGASIGAGNNIDVAGVLDLTIEVGGSFDINSFDSSTLTDLSITVNPTGLPETYSLTNFNGLTLGLYDFGVLPGDLFIAGTVATSGTPLNISITNNTTGDIYLDDPTGFFGTAIFLGDGGDITLTAVDGSIFDAFTPGLEDDPSFDPNLAIVSGSSTVTLNATGTVGTSGVSGDIDVSGTGDFSFEANQVYVSSDVALSSLDLVLDPVGDNVDIQMSGATTVDIDEFGTNCGVGGNVCVHTVDNSGFDLDLSLTAVSGDIFLDNYAIQDIGAGDITLTAEAGGIFEEQSDSHPEIVMGKLAGGVGTLTLTADTGIFNSANSIGDTALLVSSQGSSGTVDLELNRTNNGHITLVASDPTGVVGSYTSVDINDFSSTGTGTTTITAGAITVNTWIEQDGDITLEAFETAGAGNDVTIKSGIPLESYFGNITVKAGDDVIIEDSLDIGADGKIVLSAGFGDSDGLGNITIGDGVVITSAFAGADAITLSAFDLSIDTTGNTEIKATGVGGGIRLFTATGGSTMEVGGTASGANFLVSDAELDLFTDFDVLTIGESGVQSAFIRLTTIGHSTVDDAKYIVNADIGAGYIELNDGGSAAALDSGVGVAGSILLNAGTGGIKALNTTSNTIAELVTPGTITLNSKGDIGSSTKRIDFTADQDEINITTTGDDVFLHGIGDLTLAAIATAGGNLDVSQESGYTLTSGGVVTLGTGGFTFEADEIEITASISGTSDAVLRPTDATLDIEIAGVESAGELDLTTSDLSNLSDGFNLITIGDLTSGSGTITIAGAVTFTDDLRLVGGNIINDVTVLDPANLQITGEDIELIADTGIGAFDNGIDGDGVEAIQTKATRLDAETVTGGIYIEEFDGVTLEDLDADTFAVFVDTSGAIDITAGGTLTVLDDVINDGVTNTDDITLKTTAGGIVLAANVTATTLGDVRLEAFTSISNDAAITTAADLRISGDDVILVADSGIGAPDDGNDANGVEAIQTSATRLDATTDTGGIYIEEFDDVTLDDLNTDTFAVFVNTSGEIDITAGGTLTVLDDVENEGVLDADDITLKTVTAGDIVLAANVSANNAGAGAGDVTLNAFGSIGNDLVTPVTVPADVQIGGDDVILVAGTGIGAFDNGNDATGVEAIQTSAIRLDATTDTGGIYIEELNALTLEDLDADTFAVSVTTSGDINISVQTALTVLDDVDTQGGNLDLFWGRNNAGATFTLEAAVTATGTATATAGNGDDTYTLNTGGFFDGTVDGGPHSAGDIVNGTAVVENGDEGTVINFEFIYIDQYRCPTDGTCTVSNTDKDSYTDFDILLGKNTTYQFLALNGKGIVTIADDTFGTIEGHDLAAAAGADVINITGNHSGTVNTVAFTGIDAIDGRDGDDTFTLGFGNDLAPLTGAMTLTGGLGTDSLTFNDQGSIAAVGYTISSSKVTRSAGMGDMTYASMEDLTLNSSSGANAITITGGPTRHLSIIDFVGVDTLDVTSALNVSGDVSFDNVETIDINASLTAANLTVDSATSIDVMGAVNVSGTATLFSSGTITQTGTGTITAPTLILDGGGTYDLDDANNAVTTLDVNNATLGGNLNFRDDTGFAITDVNAGGNNVTLSTDGTVTQTGAITNTNLLTLTSNGGLGTAVFTLNSFNNAVTTLDADNALLDTVSFRDDGGFTVAGINVDNAVTLQSNGTVDQTDVITAPTLTLTATTGGSGNFDFGTQNNVLGTVTSSNTLNSASLRDDAGFTVGTLSTDTSVTLSTDGTVNQTGIITAPTLTLTSNGGLGTAVFTLNSFNNAVTTLDADIALLDTVSFRDDGGFTVAGINVDNAVTLQSNGTVDQTDVITAPTLTLTATTGGSGNFDFGTQNNVLGTVTSSNTLNSASLRDDAGFTVGTLSTDTSVTLSTDGTVNQTGIITAPTLTLTSNGGLGTAVFTLNTQNNVITTLDADIALLDTVSFRDDGGFAVAGINTDTSVTLSTDGTVNQTGIITAPTLTLTSNGGLGTAVFTLNSFNNAVTTLDADIALLDTVSFRDDGGFTVAGINVDNAVTLQSNGTVDQTDVITAPTLTLTATTGGSGNFDFGTQNNVLGTVTSSNTLNSASLRDDAGFTVGTLSTDTSVTLSTDGTVNQTGIITAPTLTLTSNGGLGTAVFTLNSFNNAVTTLDADNALLDTVSFRDDGGFTVAGINVDNAVTLQSNGTVDQTDVITAPTLTLTATTGGSGNFDFGTQNNVLGTVTSSNTLNSASLRDDAGFTVGTLSTDTSVTLSTDGTVNQTGIITAPTLTLTSNGGLGTAVFTLNTQNNVITTLDADIALLDTVSFRDDGGFTVAGINVDNAVTLQSNGTVDQTDVITAPTLTLTATTGGSGNFDFGTQNNVLGTVTSSNTLNSASLRDDAGFTVGTLSTDTSVTLSTDGTVNQTGIITAPTLTLTSNGGLGTAVFTLNSFNNAVTTLDADNALLDTVSFRDDGGFAVAGINTDTAATLSSDGTVTQSAVITAPTLTLTSNGGLGTAVFTLNSFNNAVTTLDADNALLDTVSFRDDGGFAVAGINTDNATTLFSSGTITQTGAIAAITLTLDGGGTYDLDDANNAVTTLDVNNAALGGDLSFRDDTGFAITDVDAGGNNVTLSTDGTVTQTGAITNTNLLTLTSNGGLGTAVFTLNSFNNAVTTLDADNALLDTVSFRDDGGFAVAGINTDNATTLFSSGTITQTGAIAAITLTLDGGGTYDLDDANNAVTTLDVNNAALGGDLSFRDDTGFAITDVDAGGNNVTLSTDGTVTQTGAITNTNLLTLTSNGGLGTAVFTLNSFNNAVTTLDADNALLDTVSFRDDGGFAVAGINTDNATTLFSSGTITQTGAIAAITLTLDGGGTYDLDDANNAVTTLDVNNAALGGDLSFRDDTGFAITDVNAGGNNVTLSTDGTVTQTGAITNTNLLTLTSNGGLGTAVFTLNSFNNAVTTLDADNALLDTVSFRDDGGFAVAGINTDTAATLSSDGTVTQSAVITAPTLTLTSNGGLGTAVFTLNSFNNAVTTLDADNALLDTVSFRDDGGFAVAGINTDNATTLFSSGTITQTGAIAAITLTLDGGGTYDLDDANNAVTTLDVNNAALGGDLSFRDDTGFAITDVNAGGNNVTLSTDGTVTQTGAITNTNLLTLTSNGGLGTAVFTLNSFNNAVTTLDADNALLDTVSFRDDGGFAVAGINTDNATTLFSSGTITQTGAIAAITLTLDGGGTYDLDDANNAVTTLDVNNAALGGDLSFRDDTGFAITDVDAGGNNVTLSTDGTVTQTGAITNTNLLTLTSNGGLGTAVFTLNSFNNAVTTLDADNALLDTVSFRDDGGFDVAGINTDTAATLSSDGTVTQSAVITAPTLTLTSNGGLGTAVFTLNSFNNAVTTLDADNALLDTVSFRDDGGFDVAGINTDTAATLSSDGTVTQSAVITAPTLTLTSNAGGGTAVFTLNTQNNVITTLDADNALLDTVSFQDVNSLIVAGVDATGNLTITIDAGAGTSSLDLRGASITAGGTITLSGNGTNDTLYATNTKNLWTVMGIDTGNFVDIVAVQQFDYSKFGNITGSGTDADELSFAVGPADVTLTDIGTDDGFKGTEANFISGIFDNMNKITGSGGGNTLTGLNGSITTTSATWEVTGQDDGKYTAAGRTLDWVDFQNLNGGTGAIVNTFDLGDLGDAITGNVTSNSDDTTTGDIFIISKAIGGTVDIQGNATWNAFDEVPLSTTSIISSTGIGILDVPVDASNGSIDGSAGVDIKNIVDADAVENLDLSNFTGFTGHLIIGGAVTPMPASMTEPGLTVDINATTLTVGTGGISTGGNLTLLGEDIILNNTGLGSGPISAGGPGGGELTIIAIDGVGGGTISAPSGPVDLDAGSGFFVADGSLQDSTNMILNFGGGPIEVAQGTATPVTFGAGSNAAGQPSATPGFTALLASLNATFGVTLNAVQITISQPAASLSGIEQLGYIDTGLFEEDLTLFGVIGNGIALALAQCEEIEGCAPNVTEEELNELIAQLDARIEELTHRCDGGDAKACALLEKYKEELNSFLGYRQQLAEYIAGTTEEAEAEAEELKDEFAAEVPPITTIEALAKMLESIKSRIAWLESLKSDPEARARLGEKTHMALTQETLDAIIEGAKAESQSIEQQIKLLQEGTRASLPAEQVFIAETGDYDDVYNLMYGPSLLMLDSDKSVTEGGYY